MLPSVAPRAALSVCVPANWAVTWPSVALIDPVVSTGDEPVMTNDDAVRPVEAAPDWVPLTTVPVEMGPTSAVAIDRKTEPAPADASKRSLPMSSVHVREAVALHRNEHDAQSTPAVTGLFVKVAIVVPEDPEF